MKPPVFVTRHLPDLASQKLLDFCEPDLWPSDLPPSPAELQQHTAGKTGLLCLLTDAVNAALMDSAPELRIISQCAVGYDNIDVPAATARGIRVGNTPGVLTETTADFAFALLLAAARRVVEGMDMVRAGEWRTWGLTTLLGKDIHDATLGLVGLGRIGAAVARRASGFNMQMLYYDVNRQPEQEAALGVRYCPLDELLAQSDFISLHVALTPETRHLISTRQLALVKPGAILVNTTRGAVVDSDALYDALKSGRLAHAALDVTDPEPLPAGHKLLELRNITIAPHIASASVATRTRMALMAVENLAAGLRGAELPYPVNQI